MRQKISLSKIMAKNHLKIEKLLTKLKKTCDKKKNYNLIQDKFNDFKWELEKHLFIEEKAIFTLFNPDKFIDNQVVFDTGDEHSLILKEMNQIEEKIKNKSQVNISRIFKLLTRHQNFEDKELYPALDKNLNTSQKKEIIKRIKKAIKTFDS